MENVNKKVNKKSGIYKTKIVKVIRQKPPKCMLVLADIISKKNKSK